MTPIHHAPARHLLVAVLGFLTILVLVLSIPGSVYLNLYAGLALIYAMITAFAIFFNVVSAEWEWSSAHVVGIVAALSLPAEAQPVTLWGLGLGAVLGAWLSNMRLANQQPHRSTWSQIECLVLNVARVCLSFFVATQFYAAIGAPLPLQRLDWATSLPIIAFSVVYVVIYFCIFLFEMLLQGRPMGRVIRVNWADLLIVVVLLVPFAIVGAEMYAQRLSPASFIILIAGLTIAIFGQFGVSRTQRQMRRQLDELKSLSVMSQVVSSNLELDALLKMIYVQVSQLLAVRNFVVGLYEPLEHYLQFPLAMRDGQPLASADAVLQEAGGLIEHVLIAQEPLLVSRDVQERARQLGLMPPVSQVVSWVGVPLLSGGRLLGAMVITSNDVHRQFDSNDVRLLNIVAANASIAVENAQLYQEQTARVSQLSMLNQILSLLTGTLSPDDVLDAVILSASTLADADAVAVYLFHDEKQASLSLVRSTGFSDEFERDPPEPLLMVRSRRESFGAQPIVVNDATQDARTPYLRPAMTREGKVAWVELPMVVGGIGLGAIGIYFDLPRTFPDEFVQLLRAFANQAAQAIRNARLYALTDEALERRVGQLLTLAAIGHELTATLDLETICSLILNHALDATNASVGMVILRDDRRAIPHIFAQRGYPGMIVAGDVLAQSLSGQAWSRGEALVANDVLNEPTYVAFAPSTRAQLSVPILRSTLVIGVVTLESDQPHSFSDEDTYFVTQIANQSVIAIENAHLFRRIAEARDRLQVILDAMAEAIILIDSAGKITLANPRVDLISLSSQQLLAQPLEALLAEEQLHLAERMGFRSESELRNILKENFAVRAENGREPVSYSLSGERGVVYIQRQILPVFDTRDEIIGVLFVFYDQTEERALTQAREDLSRMIIHDLRSPLTAVTTSLKLLTDLVPRDSEIRPAVETTTDASRRAIRKLLTRVDSLLDIARLESGQLQLDIHPASLRPLVDAVCSELNPLAQDINVRFTVEIPESLPVLAIDADKVERVLLNLLDNALKFSPLDSVVAIHASAGGENSASSGFVRIEVIDRGAGVPDEYKEPLFERFVQIQGRSGARRGSGLGLTFCRLIVEAHKGRIWIEDNPQGGSIFAFTLPVVSGDEQQTA